MKKKKIRPGDYISFPTNSGWVRAKVISINQYKHSEVKYAVQYWIDQEQVNIEVEPDGVVRGDPNDQKIGFQGGK